MLIKDSKNVIAETREEQNEPDGKHNSSVVIGTLNRIAEQDESSVKQATL